jgi:hypothetical protein
MKKYLRLSLLSMSSLLIASCTTHNAIAQQATPPQPNTSKLTETQPQYPRAHSAKQLALLLPLSGPAAKQGQAIQNGFFTAFYQANTQGYQPTIRVYDTNSRTITAIYQQAIDEGAEVVVGPLLKTELEQLSANTRFPVKTLALNTLTNPSNNTKAITNLYQFGLDPSDEVAQVAQRMQVDGRHHALVIYANNPYDQRLEHLFTPYWSSLGGQTVETISYQSPGQFSEALRTGLHLVASQKRYASLSGSLREKIRFMPRRRDDFDAIFLACSPEQGRQILPLLRFYYVTNTPIYTTSQIYAGALNTANDRDLDGVLFDDMPWLYTNSSAQQKAQQTWPTSYHAFARLYGLGYDAFRLASQLNQWQGEPISLATGTLSASEDGRIQRQLIWLRMQNGRPVAIH